MTIFPLWLMWFANEWMNVQTLYFWLSALSHCLVWVLHADWLSSLTMLFLVRSAPFTFQSGRKDVQKCFFQIRGWQPLPTCISYEVLCTIIFSELSKCANNVNIATMARYHEENAILNLNNKVPGGCQHFPPHFQIYVIWVITPHLGFV